MVETGTESHHHHHDIDAVEQSCRERGLRFTATRRAVMEILLDDPQPLGAYTILERLADAGRPGQPPMVYRALDFLINNGFAHKLSSRSAYTACAHPGEPHSATILICRSCDRVTEAEGIANSLQRAADASGFVVEETILEAEGLCLDCR